MVELVGIAVQRSLAQQLERLFLFIFVGGTELVVFLLFEYAEMLARGRLMTLAVRFLVGLARLFPRRHIATCVCIVYTVDGIASTKMCINRALALAVALSIPKWPILCVTYAQQCEWRSICFDGAG